MFLGEELVRLLRSERRKVSLGPVAPDGGHLGVYMAGHVYHSGDVLIVRGEFKAQRLNPLTRQGVKVEFGGTEGSQPLVDMLGEERLVAGVFKSPNRASVDGDVVQMAGYPIRRESQDNLRAQFPNSPHDLLLDLAGVLLIQSAVAIAEKAQIADAQCPAGATQLPFADPAQFLPGTQGWITEGPFLPSRRRHQVDLHPFRGVPGKGAPWSVRLVVGMGENRK